MFYFFPLNADEVGRHSELWLSIFKAGDNNYFIVLFLHVSMYTYYVDLVSGSYFNSHSKIRITIFEKEKARARYLRVLS